MRKLFALLCLALISTGGWAQSSLNVNLLGHLSNPALLNDVWGYADSAGNEYALIGIMTGGVGIVDVTNPASPNLLQTIPGVPSTWRDLKTFGDYGYVVNDDGGAGGNGLLVMDLSTLPGTVAYKDTVINGTEYSHNIWMDNGYLYVVGGNTTQGAEVYDLNTDPWRPNYVGRYNQRYIHDIYVRNDTGYAGELNNGLTLIDFTNKANPQVIGNRQYTGNFTHNTWLNDAGDVCFTTDEVTGGWLYAWDVSDPGNIQYLDGIQTSLGQGTTIPHNAHVLNDFIVTSWYRDGVHIVDAARPHNLIEVGYYDTSPLSGDGFNGDWGAYPFLPSGNILVSDMEDGLFVLGPNYVRGCYLEGNVTDSLSGAALSGVDIEILTTSITDLTATNGDYATGTATAGTYSVKYSKFGYEDKTISVTLSNGTLVIEDVELKPLNRVNFSFSVIEQGTGTPIPNAKVQFTETTYNVDVTYTTDANGEVNDTAFVAGTYDIIAGIWGYVTNTTSITASSGTPNGVIELEKGYYDDFVLDFGWSVFSNASTGDWERGEPIGTTFGPGNFFNPELDVPGDIGDLCYVTGNGGGGAGDDDVDDGETVLTSPTMNLSNMVEPTVRYYRWFANGGGFGGSPINDTLFVEIDNGMSITTLEVVTGSGNNSWVQRSYSISNFTTPTSSTRIRFVCGDYGDGHLVEGGVDQFEVFDADPLAQDEALPLEVDLRAYPNPIVAHSRISYSLDAAPENASVEIRDMLGRVVFVKEIHSRQGSFKVNLEGPQGIYIASLKNAGETVSTFKMIR